MSTNIIFEYKNTFSFLKKKKVFQVQESYLLPEHFNIVVFYNLMGSLHMFSMYIAILKVRTNGKFLRTQI